MTWKSTHATGDTFHWFRSTVPLAACGVPFALSQLVEPNAYVPVTEDMKCEACKERLGLREAP